MDRYRGDSIAQQDARAARVDRLLERQVAVLEAMKADISAKLDELGRKLEYTRHEIMLRSDRAYGGVEGTRDQIRNRIDQANHYFQMTAAIDNLVHISVVFSIAAMTIAAVVALLRLR